MTRAHGALLALAALGASVVVPLTASPARAGSAHDLIAYDDGTSGVFETPYGSTTQPGLVAAAGIYPQFSPGGNELAYDLERENKSGNLKNSIVIADRTGGHADDLITGGTKLNGDKDSVLYPLVWSPNGKEIAYGCDGEESADPNNPSIVDAEWEQVCVVHVDSGNHHLITDPATDDSPVGVSGLDERWSWTPNGNDILATVVEAGPCLGGEAYRYGCGSAAIGKINVNSGATTLLTMGSPTTSQQTSPSVSPDGEHIIYQDLFPNGGGTPGLYEMKSDGDGSHYVDTGGMYPGAGAIFSPDGKDILFTAFPPADPHYVAAFDMHADGSGTPVQVTFGNENVYDMSETPPATTCTVPNLKGKTLDDAKDLLPKAGCTLGKVSGPKHHQDKRTIVKQSPKPNKDEPAGTKVDVTLSKKD